MNSKKRLAISFISLGVVVLFGMAVFIGWTICLKYSLYTNITGQYKANRVMGEVNANAIFAGQFYNMTVDGEPGASKVLKYDGQEQDNIQKLNVPGQKIFELSPRFSYVVLEYVFYNASPSDEWLISLNANIDKTDNIAVFAAYSEDGITDYSLIDYEYDNEYISKLPVATTGKMFVYLKFQLVNENKSANFDANLVWSLDSREYLNNLGI